MASATPSTRCTSRSAEDYGLLKQFEAAHEVRIYSDPGTIVRVSLGRLPSTRMASGSVTLSGRLEPVPSRSRSC